MRVFVSGVCAVLLLAAQAGRAEVSMTLTGVTDYDFRGVSQTDGDPAVQLGIDYSAEHFYAGAWGSNVDFGDSTDGDFELDLLAGFAGETESGIRWDIGATWYGYPGADANEQNPADPDDDIADSPHYWELSVGAGYGPVDVKYWYSPNLYDSNETASYLEANASFGLPWELSLNLHAGYSYGDYFELLERDASVDPNYGGDDADYYDYSIGIGRSFGHFDFEVKYVDTSIDDYFEVESGPLENDGRVIFSVATTIPWAEEEK